MLYKSASLHPQGESGAHLWTWTICQFLPDASSHAKKALVGTYAS